MDSSETAILIKFCGAVLFTIFAYRRGWWDDVLPRRWKRHPDRVHVWRWKIWACNRRGRRIAEETGTNYIDLVFDDDRKFAGLHFWDPQTGGEFVARDLSGALTAVKELRDAFFRESR